MNAPPKQPAVSMSAVLGAGLASALAAVITSRFGVAGTLIGAAVTTMIITGGSVILKTYLESISGRVRRAPRKMREQASRMKEPWNMARPDLPGRPDLRNNFMGRLRAALDWFSNLSPLRRRSIIGAALVPALVAFLIGIGTITAAELGTGKSLSCGVWSKCPEAATASDSTGGNARTSLGLLLGGDRTDSVDEVQDQQQVADPAQNQQVPQDSGVQQAQPDQPGQRLEPANPQQSAPPDSGTPASPAPEDPVAEDPVVEQPPPEEQAPVQPPASGDPVSPDPSGGAAQEPAAGQ